jgi:tetratricopeptide (TPR) repeat protein
VGRVAGTQKHMVSVALWLAALSLCTALGAAAVRQSSPLGRISFPTSGSAAAQPAFVRGVLFLHSFEYDDAIAAFREAQRVDPGFAMAYWGEAMCYNQPLWFNENVQKARAVLARLGPSRAARQSRAPTPREQGYLDAVERLFGDGGKPARDRAYLDRMATLSRDNPGDDEAAAFHALALLATIPSGRRDPAVSLRAGAIASAILKRNPEHPGAAHYALHAYDDGEHAAMGLEAARTYARIAPASSHARHMPSHIFLPLGMWDEAAASDESAFAASVAWVQQKGASLAQEDFHSLSWLQYEYLQQGRFAKAADLLKPVEAALQASSASRGSAPPRGRPVPPSIAEQAGAVDHEHHFESEIGRGFGPVALESELASMRARLVVESGGWRDMQGKASFGNVDELFALGLSSVKLGDRARAAAALEQLHGAQRAAPDADTRRLAEIMTADVDGLLQLANGKRAPALAALRSAAQLEAAMPKPIARPYPVKPAAEIYGEALLAAGKGAEAMTQFRAALARTPRRAASLIGLARAAHAAGRPADASRAAREFLAIWRRADPDRPELAEARALSKPPRR